MQLLLSRESTRLSLDWLGIIKHNENPWVSQRVFRENSQDRLHSSRRVGVFRQERFNSWFCLWPAYVSYTYIGIKRGLRHSTGKRAKNPSTDGSGGHAQLWHLSLGGTMQKMQILYGCCFHLRLWISHLTILLYSSRCSLIVERSKKECGAINENKKQIVIIHSKRNKNCINNHMFKYIQINCYIFVLALSINLFKFKAVCIANQTQLTLCCFWPFPDNFSIKCILLY